MSARHASDPLLEMLTAYQLPAVIASAERLGVLDELTSPTSPGRIARRRGLSSRGVEAILGVLLAAGLASARRDGTFALTADGRRLVREGDGGLRRVVRKEAFFARLWTGLDQAVRTGRALLPETKRRALEDPDGYAAFLAALNDLAAPIADAVLEAADFGDPRLVLDVGGGGGAFALAARRRHPRARVVILELPEVAPLTRQLIDQAADRLIEVVPGDARDARTGRRLEPFDGVLISHVLHDLAPPDAARVIANVVRWLRPGGIVAVHDVLPEGRPDVPTALFDVMMLIENPGGRVHQARAVRRWLTAAGTTRARRTRIGWTSVLRAVKRR